MQKISSPWRDGSEYLCGNDSQGTCNAVVTNGGESSLGSAKQVARRRSEVAFLMDKLVSEQQKALNLEEQLTVLKNELEVSRSASHNVSRDVMLDSFQSTIPVRTCINNSISQDALWDGPTPHSLSAVPFIPPIWASRESGTLSSVTLPQLLSKRNELLSSLHTLSDVIARKRLSSPNTGGIMTSVSRENEAVIQACMHRLLGEAFYVNSVGDIKELLSVAGGVSGREMEIFDTTLQIIINLLEEAALESYENVQEFILHPSSHFKPEWRSQYVWSMRRLLVAFAVNSRKSSLLEARRTGLERIAQQEVLHKALLRALQGRDVVPPSINCLPPEVMTATKAVSRAGAGAGSYINAERHDNLALQNLPHPVTRRRHSTASPRVETLPSRTNASGTQASTSARSRWNPPRFNTTTTAPRRDESARGMPPPRTSLFSTNTPRRRTASSLGLSGIYTRSCSRNNLQRPSHTPLSTRENSHAPSAAHDNTPRAGSIRGSIETPMIGLPVQSSMSPRTYSAARGSTTPRRRS